jgi:hypothetical protein
MWYIKTSLRRSIPMRQLTTLVISIIKQATSSLFADDTSIYYSHSDIKQLEATLNSELQNLDIWMKSNKLSVNISKSNYLIFHPSQKKLSLNLRIISNIIISKTAYKILRCIFR